MPHLHLEDEPEEPRTKVGALIVLWAATLICGGIAFGYLNGAHESRYQMAALFAALGIGSGFWAESIRKGGRKKSKRNNRK